MNTMLHPVFGLGAILVSTLASASPPPFICSIYTQWELASRTDLTPAQIESREFVIGLFEDAEAFSGKRLDFIFAETAKKYPTAQWAYVEMADELVKINHAGYRDTPCFAMSELGLEAILPLFDR